MHKIDVKLDANRDAVVEQSIHAFILFLEYFYFSVKSASYCLPCISENAQIDYCYVFIALRFFFFFFCLFLFFILNK